MLFIPVLHGHVQDVCRKTTYTSGQGVKIKHMGVMQSFSNPACSENMSEIDRVFLWLLMHRLSILQRASDELSTRHQSSW